MGNSRRVVMTGAAGQIGTAIVPLLSSDWDIVLTDLKPGTGAVLDVTDGTACRAAFDGADAVVHLAANPDPDATWQELLAPNVVGAFTVTEAAMACGVRRLVLASSLQAVMAYPFGSQRRVSDPPRPANIYGATKAWAEAIGSWAAASSETSVVALRIGYFALQPPPATPEHRRDRGGWLSPRDAAQLVRCAVESPVNGLVVVNGTSANRYPNADLTQGRAAIGFTPVDDAWAQ